MNIRINLPPSNENIEYVYRTIAANILTDKDKHQITDMLNSLALGWEIYSAVGVAGGVHYILIRRKIAE